jgi:thioredoxin reductase
VTRVLIVGGGPAGLTAAATLAPLVDGEVLVLDREQRAGGIPRHSAHPGYGLRDLGRFVSGPGYARRLVTMATQAGAVIRTQAMATGWTAGRTAEVTSPEGRFEVPADVVVLATGARERPRPARLIPGDRPDGVYTTGHLQSLVHLHHGIPGARAVVVGAELVSWSAVLTLRAAGARTLLMTTHFPTPECHAAVTFGGRIGLRVPVATSTRVIRIIGRRRVEAVEVEHLGTRARRLVECDTVVFTGDWIPDHELARSAGVELDTGSRGPVVDAGLRTNQPGVFAIGNLVHPVDTADVAALDGRHVAGPVLAWLRGEMPAAAAVRVSAGAPFRWIAPQLVRADALAPARGRYLLWSDELVRSPHVSVRQDGREIAHRRLPWPVCPGRVFRLPASLFAALDVTAGPVTVGLR